MRQEGVLLALLKRCTSSTNTRVRCCMSPSRAAWARSTASRMSFTPPSTALMLMNCASNASAISRAMVVCRRPAGPTGCSCAGGPTRTPAAAACPAPAHAAGPPPRPVCAGAGLRPGAGASQGEATRSVGFRVIKWSAHGPERLLHHRPCTLEAKQQVALYLQAQAAIEIIAPTIPLIWPMAGAIQSTGFIA